MAARGRHGARRLLVQALYQYQVGGSTAAELVQQYSERPEFEAIDSEYFLTLLTEITDGITGLDAHIARTADRPIEQLDPIERAVLWIGLAELEFRSDIPLKVVLNEAVKLSRQFGSQDGYRFVNAVLDKSARMLRESEAR